MRFLSGRFPIQTVTVGSRASVLLVWHSEAGLQPLQLPSISTGFGAGGLRMGLIHGVWSWTRLEGSRVPDPREDLESRSPNLGPYTTKDTL